MTALCYHCGTSKALPLGICPACKLQPQSDDEIACSLLLSDQVLGQVELQTAAQTLQSGREVQFPIEAKLAAIRAYRQANGTPKPAVAQGKKISLKVPLIVFSVLALFIATAFALLHPWPQFEWAKHKNDIPTYVSFLNRFSSSKYYPEANNNLRILRDDIVWKETLADPVFSKLRFYIKMYPDGKHLAEAEKRASDLVETEWQKVAQSESEEDLKLFTMTYPNTARQKDAYDRIQALHDDFNWLKKKNDLGMFRQFVARFPSHREIESAKKIIIDLEVKEISEGKYGELPAAQPTRRGGSVVKVEVANDTGYELTVLYSGTDSQKLVIPVGQTGRTTLPPGDYRVAASVNATSVTNYYGQNTLEAGEYSSNFYIETTSYGGSSSGGSFNMPSFRKKGRR